MSFNNQSSAHTAPVRSNFVSETEIEERRKKRQEEWDKVRQPHQPEEAPEEDYDGRSLFHRLQEQKDKKQAEFEEAHKLKNMIKGLDNDEIQFLDLVDKTKEDMEAKILSEEGKVIEEYRRAVRSLSAEAEEQKLRELKGPSLATTSTGSSHSKNQQALLAGVIKRKRSSSEKGESNKLMCLNNDVEVNSISKVEEDKSSNENNGVKSDVNAESDIPRGITSAGVLPGLSAYTDSSDSELSSSSEIFDGQEYDLVGRIRPHSDALQRRDKT
ncbi:hypothetical protein CHUAL_011787 [Chamberlinius hualienensis]